MAKNIDGKTKEPSGLSIARDGYKFVFGWKIGDSDYGDGQTFQYRLGSKGTWQSISVDKKATSAKLNTQNLLSGFIDSVAFRVRGNRKSYKSKTSTTKKKKKYTAVWTVDPVVSDWADKTFNVKYPNKPSVSAGWSSEYWNRCTFSGSVADVKDDANEWYTGFEWQSILLQNSNVASGKSIASKFKSSTSGWTTNTGTSASYTWTKDEDTSLIAGKSYTRYFRVRSLSTHSFPADGGWVYAQHVYAAPLQAVIDKKNTYGKANNAGGTDVKVTWTADSSYSRPIDSVTVQYVLVTPGNNLACPAGATGWQDIGTSKDTKKKDSIVSTVPAVPGTDQCMYVRVNTKHDNEVTEGIPFLIRKGSLATPTNLSVSTNASTHKATITATNASNVPDSFLVVRYQSTKVKVFDIGIIPHGSTSVTVQCPNWGTQAVKFYVQAVQGSYTATSRPDGANSYSVTRNMTSTTQSSGGVVPQPPSTVSLARTDIPGTIRVTWNWSWEEATGAELSWSDREDAWESTDEPATFTVDNTYRSAWNIAGLETGKVWYVRVRLFVSDDNNKTYSDYSSLKSINLSSAPAIPVLNLSDTVVSNRGKFTATWAYVSTDGTAQAYAKVARVTGTATNPVYTTIGSTQTAQYMTFQVSRLGWTAGNKYGLAVKVVSESGHESDGWSETVYIDVADPITATISSTSLVTKTIDERSVVSLAEMPLSVTVTGAGTNGTTIVAVERLRSYHLYRPDESRLDGFEGETVAIRTQTGESAITFNNADLIGRLDDGAQYRIVATTKDNLGQTATATRTFEVHWNHQAVMPQAKVYINDTAQVAELIPVAPTGVGAGDVCDIYRLSIDAPVLIYRGATFGSRYVDPYPTIGEYGGYRFVFVTKNGDYITEDNELAWVDVYDTIDQDDANIIDYDTGRVVLTRNIDLSNDWKKDFQETQYLGGAVQGDWNPAVSRNASLSAKALPLLDDETIESMRRLAMYPGLCHVRTKEGSNFVADVQVKEDYKYATGFQVVDFSLSITRVDPQELDGLTYADWLATQAKGHI